MFKSEIWAYAGDWGYDFVWYAVVVFPLLLAVPSGIFQIFAELRILRIILAICIAVWMWVWVLVYGYVWPLNVDSDGFGIFLMLLLWHVLLAAYVGVDERFRLFRTIFYLILCFTIGWTVSEVWHKAFGSDD